MSPAPAVELDEFFEGQPLARDVAGAAPGEGRAR
jgi:hypothetical protein